MKTNKFIAAQIFLLLLFGWQAASAEVTEFTSFPLMFSQLDCDQAKISFPDSKSFEVSTETSPPREDCSDVKAGRGAFQPKRW